MVVQPNHCQSSFPAFPSLILEVKPLQRHLIRKMQICSKYSSVEVIVLKNFQTCIPKGECRQELLEAGRVKKVQLSRYMTANEVKSNILEEFDCGDFSLLECFKGRFS